MHKRKKRDWAENDYYDSDEDTFLDRTGLSKCQSCDHDAFSSCCMAFYEWVICFARISLVFVK